MGDIEQDKIGQVYENADIELDNAKILRVRKVYYRNEFFIDVRHWVRFRGADTFTPTKKGAFLKASIAREKLLPLLEEWTKE